MTVLERSKRKLPISWLEKLSRTSVSINQKSTKKMKYKAVFLDMDHTLCDTRQADKLGLVDFQHELVSLFPQKTAMEIGAEYLDVIYGKNKSHSLWQKQSSETESEFRARLLKLVIEQEPGIEVSWPKALELADKFMEMRVKHFDFFPGADTMLTCLKKHYTLVLVSNGPLFSQKPKIDKVAMHKYCNHIILGGELKEQKPHPSIFMLACRKAGCSNREAIHVGDLPESDIKGARNAGIDSVLVGEEGSLAASCVKPDYYISKITDLQNLLEKIEANYLH